MNKKISVVGIGMDGEKTLTFEAKHIIENAEVLIGASRMLKPFEYLGKDTFVSYKSQDIVNYINECSYKKIAVLMSGDCGFYSGAEGILPMLGGYDTEAVCGISTPVYFCAKLKIPWQNVKFVSLHGKDGNIIRNVCSNEYTFFLLGGDIDPGAICRKLCEYKLGETNVYIGENFGSEAEHIKIGKASDFTEIITERLCAVIVHNENFERYLKCCIEDSEFVRGKVPMTKSEVRGICVSKLEISRCSVCWDIGCGTGSVAIEMAVRCPDGKVYAIDKNPDAIALTDENRHKFGCDNIEIIEGNAESSLVSLPAPDRVFIGGSGGMLREVVKEAINKNPSVKIIITAVSLETLCESKDIFEKLGADTEIIQAAVTRTRKIGSHTMFNAENPIFIIRGEIK